MYRFNMFPSWRHSVPKKGLNVLEDIFKYSKDLELDNDKTEDYNKKNRALEYITSKLKKIEEKNSFFTIVDFEKILRDMPRYLMSKEQAEDLKMISRGFTPKHKKEAKETKETEELEEMKEIEEETKKEKSIAETLDEEYAASAGLLEVEVEKQNAALAKEKEYDDLRKMAKDI